MLSLKNEKKEKNRLINITKGRMLIDVKMKYFDKK